jgi:hypothetical protein
LAEKDVTFLLIRQIPFVVLLGQLIIRYPMSTEYWTGWPDQNDVYGFPHSWQWEFQKTFVNLEPVQ